jgi:aminopeptidase N
MYRDTALLYDENVSSEKDKKRVASVIAHEVAHQWFGNLVSPAYWDGLFLNEAFATYMEYIAVAQSVEPYWRMEDQFLYMETQKALDTDSSLYTHPVAAKGKDMILFRMTLN